VGVGRLQVDRPRIVHAGLNALGCQVSLQVVTAMGTQGIKMKDVLRIRRL
jgi:hypothetical protein